MVNTATLTHCVFLNLTYYSVLFVMTVSHRHSITESLIKLAIFADRIFMMYTFEYYTDDNVKITGVKENW